MLVSRLMPLMDLPFRFHLLSHMILNFPDWGATKNSEIDKTYPFLRHCVFSAQMSNIIFTFNGNVPAAVYESMLTSKVLIELTDNMTLHAQLLTEILCFRFSWEFLCSWRFFIGPKAFFRKLQILMKQ